MSKYEIILYWSQADEAFIAEVPELPGCAADGKTYKEALANVEIIIQEWLETAKNSAAPSPPRAAASPSLKHALQQFLQVLSAQARITHNAF
jgi:predicted RNase H-like HicB family nuclease